MPVRNSEGALRTHLRISALRLGAITAMNEFIQGDPQNQDQCERSTTYFWLLPIPEFFRLEKSAMSRRAPPNAAAERAAQNQQTIKTLLKLEGNKSCADCKRNKRE